MSDLKDFVIEKGVLKKYVGGGGTVVVPDGVTKIGQKAFGDGIGIIKIVLPKTVKEIVKSAFSGFADLEEINLPEGLETLGMYALKGCSALRTLHIPSSLNEVYATSLGEVGNITVAEGSLYSICDKCLIKDGILVKYFDQISEQFTIPEKMHTIGSAAFRYNKGVKKVIIPKTVKKVEDGAFSVCPSIEIVEYQGNMERIEYATFSDCPNLKTVILPQKLKRICSHAFEMCPNLSIEEVPVTLKYIEGYAFDGYMGKPFFDEKSQLWEDIINNKNVTVNAGLLESSAGRKTKSELVKEYLFEGRKKLGVEIVDGFKWLDCKKITLKTSGLFKFNDETIQPFVQGMTVSANSAKRLGSFQNTKLLGKNCKFVHFIDGKQNPEKMVEKILGGKSVKYEMLRGDCYLEYKPEDLCGSHGSLYDDCGRLGIEFEKEQDGCYAEINLENIAKGVKVGELYLPFRFRAIDKKLNKINIKDFCVDDFGVKWLGCKYVFKMGDDVFTLFIRDEKYGLWEDGTTGFIDTKTNYGLETFVLGQDESGVYVDCVMAITLAPPYL